MGLHITVDRVYVRYPERSIYLVRLWWGGLLIDQLTLEQFEQAYGFRAANDLLRR